jgi:N-acetylneuraminate synthase
VSGSFDIGRAAIGGGACFVIAEAGVNHDGDLDKALALVDAAAAAGADAVKFQTFSADRLVTADAPKARYQERDASASQHEMLRRLELAPANYRRIADYCNEKGIVFLSSPFDEDSADLLEALDIAAFKIPSGELINIPFLQHVARKRRPMIVSTGMATLGEVRGAVAAIAAAGCERLALLHCVSAYPAEPRDANLRAMATLRREFDVPVGWSDHTLGTEVSLAAAALGADIIEKHLTLDRTAPGPDHAASLEPDELASLVRGIRTIASALGSGEKRPAEAELEIAAVARKSLVAARALRAGETLAAADVVLRRPGTGLPPMWLDRLLGRRAARAVEAGALLREEWFV